MRQVLALGFLLILPTQGHAEPVADTAAILTALQAEDMRIATIAHRLTIANAALCTKRAARTGLEIHDLSQYALGARPAARDLFAFASPIAVEGVVKGSAADLAGVRANDSLVAVNGETLEPGPADTGKDETTDRVIRAEAKIQDLGLKGDLHLSLLRAGKPLSVTISAPSGCASRFEVVVKDMYDARADGAIVQISTKMIEGVPKEDELAYVIAHEMAHNILRHRDRLDAAGVDRGMLEGFGRSVGYIRRSELEADILGVALAANAGYDVDAGARWWRWFGPAHFNSILLARTHPRWSTRAKVLDREAAAIKASGAKPYVPSILAERDKPLSNDWQSLVAGL